MISFCLFQLISATSEHNTLSYDSEYGRTRGLPLNSLVNTSLRNKEMKTTDELLKPLRLYNRAHVQMVAKQSKVSDTNVSSKYRLD